MADLIKQAVEKEVTLQLNEMQELLRLALARITSLEEEIVKCKNTPRLEHQEHTEAPFYTIFQFFSLPALVAQQVHVEGPVQIQPWWRDERRRL